MVKCFVKNKKLIVALSALFAVTEAVIGVLMHTSQGSIPINLRYTSVVLACLFFTLFAERSLSYIFTHIALIGTVCADYFLVWRDDMLRLPAMIFFSVAQIAYFARLYFEDESPARRKVHLILRAAFSLVAIVVTAIVLGENCDAVALVSMFYYANLGLNVVFAFISVKKNTIFALGLLFFILCDTVIGLSLINMYLPVSEGSVIYSIIHPGFDLAWAFYLPSQALLAISLIGMKNKKCVDTIGNIEKTELHF